MVRCEFNRASSGEGARFFSPASERGHEREQPDEQQPAWTRVGCDRAALGLGVPSWVRVDAAAAWVDFFDKGRLDSKLKSEFEEIAKRSRQRYLISPTRIDQILAESRSQLRQNTSHSDSWTTIAEILGAQGNALMDRSDYIRGLSFLKLSVYIYAQLDKSKETKLTS